MARSMVAATACGTPVVKSLWDEGHGPFDGRSNCMRHARRQVSEIGDLCREPLCYNLHCVAAGEWRAPRQHLKHHASEAVDICPSVEIPLAASLLWAHVGGSPRRRIDTDALPPLEHFAVNRPRDSEVRNVHVVVCDEDVLGLDVTVEYAVFVSMVERTCNTARDMERFIKGETATSL